VKAVPEQERAFLITAEPERRCAFHSFSPKKRGKKEKLNMPFCERVNRDHPLFRKIAASNEKLSPKKRERVKRSGGTTWGAQSRHQEIEGT